MKTILVPLDFSDASRSVVDAACQLARLANGRIILLHVIQPPVIVSDYGPLLDNLVSYTAAMEKDVKRRLVQMQSRLQNNGVATEIVSMGGIPTTTIVDQAKKSRADYVVMGSHGRTAFYDLLVGSTTAGVLKRASCPVLVVPSPKKKLRKVKR